jgi:hypothetical protein
MLGHETPIAGFCWVSNELVVFALFSLYWLSMAMDSRYANAIAFSGLPVR